MKTPEKLEIRSQWRRSGAFIVNYDQISHIILAYVWTHLQWASLTRIPDNLPTLKMLIDITHICSKSPTLKTFFMVGNKSLFT